MRPMEVIAVRPLTRDITEFTLVPGDCQAATRFAPGAHITVETPSGAMRRYSLVNPGTDPESYVIAIQRDRASRGGSQSMHDAVCVGTILNVSEPENSFSLPQATKYLLIAGGIGITPIYAMARHIAAKGASFRMIYCTRNAEGTAYLSEIKAAFGAELLVHHDEGDPAQLFDFWGYFEQPKPLQVMCCGPQPLMDEIKSISGHWPDGKVRFEDFKPVEVTRKDDTEFDVTLQRSGQTIRVPADRSILEAARDAGVRTASSCESGTCGSCKTGLVQGDADHRDLVLTDKEKRDHIMICVSRAKSGGLVIDL